VAPPEHAHAPAAGDGDEAAAEPETGATASPDADEAAGTEAL